MIVRTAAVAWKLRSIRGDSGYFGHLHDLISAAHGEGAELVVLPELHCLELLHLEPNLAEHLAPIYLAQYAEAIEAWMTRIANSSGLTIVSGSHFCERGGAIYNVGTIARPGHAAVNYQKNNLTRYEREVWKIADGAGLAATEPALGVTVCYDVEFPNAARNLAEAGVKILAVPSWTETQRGHQRVRWTALARAVENQIFVVQSPLLGGIGREPVPMSYGSAAIIAPSVEPFPTDAILRETPLNEEGVIVADLNLDDLSRSRGFGEVTNWRDRNSGDWTVTFTADASETIPDNADGGLN
ncbi:MAG: nitrilase-related carbon-nitrogen hydrolase [Fimbriimonadaceae bacterium]|nr:nitrilase-related carbon-nitrogen hydrolase [Fimbriimonadaceae bacterium]